jgi:hypothetical protein
MVADVTLDFECRSRIAEKRACVRASVWKTLLVKQT